MANYPEYLVTPMREELSKVGFKHLRSPEEVIQAFEAEGTTLCVVNSVCGCAARNARPGAAMSLQGNIRPDHLVTVFAGMELEAVEKAREYFLPYPPSSPAMALFKNGKLVFFLERRQIEGATADMISQALKQAYEQHCLQEHNA